MNIAMKRQDLIELYQLAGLYNRTYAGSSNPEICRFLSSIRGMYAKQYKGESIENARNPRGAGRKAVYTEEENKKILEMRNKGLTFREIAKTVGCSTGPVQSVLRNQKRDIF